MSETTTLIASFEGGSVYSIDRNGRCFLEVNESACYDMLDEDDRVGLQPVKTLEFSSAAERTAYVESRGWGRTRDRSAFEDLGSS